MIRNGFARQGRILRLRSVLTTRTSLRSGFTLVELTVAFAILAIMVVIIIGTINPILLYERSIDDRRKKDINYIRLAMEDYYTDKGCYPSANMVSTVLMNPANCGSVLNEISFAKQWPCDPITKQPYLIAVDSNGCSHKFKVFTKLANVSDNPVTKTWTSQNRPYMFGFTNTNPSMLYSGVDFNHGVANYGTKWESPISTNSLCLNFVGCFYFNNQHICSLTGNCSGSNCYVNSGSCNSTCQVSSCPVPTLAP